MTAPGHEAAPQPEPAGRTEHFPDGQPQVVVGLDGSAASHRALLFATSEALLRDAAADDGAGKVGGYGLPTATAAVIPPADSRKNTTDRPQEQP